MLKKTLIKKAQNLMNNADDHTWDNMIDFLMPVLTTLTDKALKACEKDFLENFVNEFNK